MINNRLCCTVITIAVLFCLLLDRTVHAHGFAANMLIRSGDGQRWWTIEHTVDHIGMFNILMDEIMTMSIQVE